MASGNRAGFSRAAVMVALLFVSRAWAQPPDFSGKWVVVPESSAAGATQGSAPPTLSAQGNMGSGWPPEIQLTQDASTLIVQFTYYHPRDVQPPIIFKYFLDGSTSRNAIDLGRGTQEQVSRTRRDGDSLVITTTHSFLNPITKQPMTSETRQKLTLASPTQLIIETARSAVMGGQSSTTKTTYSRKN
jgi:hypothetical protein